MQIAGGSRWLNAQTGHSTTSQIVTTLAMAPTHARRPRASLRLSFQSRNEILQSPAESSELPIHKRLSLRPRKEAKTVSIKQYRTDILRLQCRRCRWTNLFVRRSKNEVAVGVRSIPRNQHCHLPSGINVDEVPILVTWLSNGINGPEIDRFRSRNGAPHRPKADAIPEATLEREPGEKLRQVQRRIEHNQVARLVSIQSATGLRIEVLLHPPQLLAMISCYCRS